MDDLFNDDTPVDKITINKKYAEKFQKFKECQELDRLKQKYGDNMNNLDESSSSSESEDEDAEALTPQLEKDFLKTLSLIKSKDPTIYKKETIFYKVPSTENESTSDEKAKKDKDKPLLLKDYERKRLLEKGDQAYVTDSDEETDVMTNDFVENKNALIYDDEQAEIKKSLEEAINDEENEDNNDELLQIREKSQEETEKENNDYNEWIKSQQGGLFGHYWNNTNELDENEKFLRDYILKRQYKDGEEILPTYNDIVDDSNDEEEDELEREEEFERKFNFRYEEPDQDFIKRYPRTVADSVRRKDDRRSTKRKEREERKKKEKEKKKEEIKKLKNLKRKEIMNKLEKLKDITGNNKIDILEDDLAGDFDAAKYDEIMQKVFDNDYYAEDDGEKPVFSDDGMSDEENWDEWDGKDVDVSQQNHDSNNKEIVQDLHCEDPGFNMDADFDETDTLNASGKKGKKLSKFAKAVKRKKPVFDPNEKTFEEYLKEYYELDYEDIIDDMPVRFKYRSVLPNDFGLSTEEILHADDKELNQWCSLRKTMKYITDDEEFKERMKFKKKARNKEKKKQIFNFLQNEVGRNESRVTNRHIARGITTELSSNSSSDRGFKKHKVITSNYLKPNKQSHVINKKKHFIQSKHKFNNNRINNKRFNSKRKSNSVNELSTTKTKNLRKQFKGGNKDVVNKISVNRLAAYGLDKRKKKDNLN